MKILFLGKGIEQNFTNLKHFWPFVAEEKKREGYVYIQYSLYNLQKYRFSRAISKMVLIKYLYCYNFICLMHFPIKVFVV